MGSALVATPLGVQKEYWNMEENELNKIFEDYEKTKKLEQEIKKENDVKTNNLKNRTKKMLEEIVIPLFEKTKKQLIEKGHKSEMYVREDTYICPSATLMFKPEVKDFSNVHQTEGSTLTIGQKINGAIEIDMKIKGRKKSKTDTNSYTSEYDETRNLQDITSEYVESKIHMMIKETMESY